ncbi:hemerythrin domain-containing protein [Neobacillus sp. OS1-32]|jgi:hypothetical protein|uniref:Hemerythrin domain-containing protein n=1 Tax=Neobacillus paridis TaxID=2803862 RepID=A0ABS1TRH4_9BACI|nr:MULTISPECIES: hemerythrin domain-containing protein [Neobacillus]MBL4953918.1 hemerythrin domain-containing protein [Neobacillus paridis]WML31031.1 hemerythrin domain-containing protein [Neobacillus sp. OS1-32]
MTGPSLRKKHSHHAIHDGIFTEARELTNVLKELFKDHKKQQQQKEVCDALLEHWETRTLAHAQSEEEGFFEEKLAENPDLLETIIQLKRDHEILELIVKQIKHRWETSELTEEIVRCFDALLVVFEIHNMEEESKLFVEQKG